MLKKLQTCHYMESHNFVRCKDCETRPLNSRLLLVVIIELSKVDMQMVRYLSFESQLLT